MGNTNNYYAVFCSYEDVWRQFIGSIDPDHRKNYIRINNIFAAQGRIFKDIIYLYSYRQVKDFERLESIVKSRII